MVMNEIEKDVAAQMGPNPAALLPIDLQANSKLEPIADFEPDDLQRRLAAVMN